MDNNTKEFKKYLNMFVLKAYEILPTEETKKIINVFEKLNMEKVVSRVNKKLSKYNNEITSKNEEMFNNKINIFPNLNVSDIWKKTNDEQKDKLWSLLNVLYVMSDLIIQLNSNKEQESIVDLCNNDSTVDNKEDFNPYIGINSNSENAKYDITQMYSGPKDLPNEKKSQGVPGMGLLSQMGNLNKMINMDKFKDDIKNLNKDDIKEATNNIKNMFGDKADSQTNNLISDMLDNISQELETANLDNGNPFSNIMKIAESVAKKMKPQVENSNIDLEKVVSATGMDQNPFNMVQNMMKKIL